MTIQKFARLHRLSDGSPVDVAPGATLQANPWGQGTWVNSSLAGEETVLVQEGLQEALEAFAQPQDRPEGDFFPPAYTAPTIR